MIQMELPAPTSVNRLYTKDRKKTKQYRAWCEEAGKVIMTQRPAWNIKALHPRSWYCTHFRHPLNARYDIDNAKKAVHDLLASMQITPDDRLLFATAGERDVAKTDNTVTVTVWVPHNITKPQFVPLVGTINGGE